MQLYTKTGDSGETGLFDGRRVRKACPRTETYGTIDELNSLLGLARAEPLPESVEGVLGRVQCELFEVGAELATLEDATRDNRTIGPKHVEALESDIDRLQSNLAPLQNFILPTGTRAAATLHVARAVCRRAERRLFAAIDQAEEAISPVLGAYLNRLSDLLFVLARAINADAGRPEVPWRKPP